VKGAPERIIAMCASQHGEENGTEPLDPAYWHARARDRCERGQRVLAIATKAADPQAGADLRRCRTG
jgi:magnesium-transporting ATPase (P-type)